MSKESKVCGEPAKFVVIEDPKNPNLLCKWHGPEKVLKRMGLLYRKARAGEKCGQIKNLDVASIAALETWTKTSSEKETVKAFEKFFPKEKSKQGKKVADIKQASVEMLKKLRKTGNVNEAMDKFKGTRKT